MSATRRRFLWLLLVPLVLGAALVAFRSRADAERYTTAQVDRGDIAEVVGATGTLEAVTTVQIGSQVSGTIDSLNADFNSTVHKGQVIARLDPSILQARLGQAKANLQAAKANVDRARSTVEDTRQKYERARELASQQLLPTTDLETAKANYEGALAQLKANEAAQVQALANVNQAEVDLSHTVIATPIDGVVISRNVDVGQTVAASFQAPVLFVIANDLARMRVNASVDEADVGRVREGQSVLFHVDAYPEREFTGQVEQVRLNPTTVSNVVTYNAIIAVSNDRLLLRPGMTATVSIQVRKADDVLRLPAAALRFRPEGFERTSGTRGARSQGQSAGNVGPASGTAGGAPAATAQAPAAAARSARRAGRRRSGGVTGAAGFERGRGDTAGRGRSTTVFILGEEGKPKPVPVTVGISDGQYVEVRDGLQEGASVITGSEIGGATRGAPGAGASPSSPFSPQFQRRQR